MHIVCCSTMRRYRKADAAMCSLLHSISTPAGRDECASRQSLESKSLYSCHTFSMKQLWWLFVTTTVTILWSLCRSACVSQQRQLRTGRILLVQSFTAHMPLLTATSAFALGWFFECSLSVLSALPPYLFYGDRNMSGCCWFFFVLTERVNEEGNKFSPVRLSICFQSHFWTTDIGLTPDLVLLWM